MLLATDGLTLQFSSLYAIVLITVKRMQTVILAGVIVCKLSTSDLAHCNPE